ncbi:MAG: hypothetical protein Q7R43_02610 [Candidatus Daviesbacteria bacterium]|nr:hypothetical protein [Candidatus Daviesbacteria bacterium]
MEKFLEEFDGELQLNNFQSAVGYREIAKSPFVVTFQTHELLGLYQKGIIPNFSLGRDYLKDFTLDYIKNAESNCASIFDRNGNLATDVDVESREAVAHAYTIFSWLPDMTALPAVTVLKDGLSRKGMLKPPLSREEFLARTKELKIELAKIAFGTTLPHHRPKIGDPLFKTQVFFRVAASFNPIFKLTVQERAAINRVKDIKFMDKFSNPEIF